LKKSNALSEEEKELVLLKLNSRLTTEGILILNCDEDRSQLKNKAILTKRFLDLIQKALIVPKIRKTTKIPKSVIRKRIKDKKNLSEIKKTRRRPEF
jgi:ribosome-associated protein